VDEQEIRAYLEIGNVMQGIFHVAGQLYGLTFKEITADVPAYEPTAKAYEVLDKDGTTLAIFYSDNFPRASKRAGAWCTSFRGQSYEGEERIIPIVVNCCNMTAPTGDGPALQSIDNVETLFHEFGHALHSFMRDVRYNGAAGVERDFVELPSQIMENFLPKKEFLATFAHHYETGELIPDELIERIVRAQNYNVAYMCIRQLSFGILDMAWYSRTTPFEGDVLAYEQKAWESTQLLPVVEGTNITTRFGHIMSGGYSAGYYSYKWSEMLDADAFALFEEKGIFSQEVASSFRENILSRGGSEHPKELYRRFRGQDATLDAMMKRDGIVK
jgi:peptidyl-dipeptidase Dcp